MPNNSVVTRPPPPERPKNHLLRSLPPEDFARLLPYLTTIPTVARHVFHKYGEALEYVYFPNGGVASVTALLGDGIETVVVKQAVGRFAARSLAPSVACDRIRAGAASALRRKHPVFKLSPPIRLEVDFALTQMADMAELVPGSIRTGGRTVSYEGDDYREVFRAWRAMYNLASVE